MTKNPTLTPQPELLPCPFCGGPATRDQIEQDERPWFVIACDNAECGAMANVSAWNRRAPSPQANVEAQIEWLKARLASLQLPAGKRDHDTREKWLLQCGMPDANAAGSDE